MCALIPLNMRVIVSECKHLRRPPFPKTTSRSKVGVLDVRSVSSAVTPACVLFSAVLLVTLNSMKSTNVQTLVTKGSKVHLAVTHKGIGT